MPDVPLPLPAHAPWRDALVARMRLEAQPPEKFSHQARLYALACELGSAAAFDDDIVFAAAWVHDLGVFLGHRPEEPDLLRSWDSTAYTLAHAGTVLLQCGFPAAKVDTALACIRTHEAQHTPATVEGTLLRDADLLEQLGAVAVMRTVAKIGRDTRFQTFAHAAAALQRALDNVPAQLRLPAARALAAPRIAALRSFLDALHAEAGGHL